MTNHWDEFSKSLAEDSLSRRQSLRRLGAALAGAVLSPFEVGIAWAGRQDPCQAFCNRCSTKTRNQCLNACRACSGNTSRLGGSCGNYTCCSTAACNGVCSDLRSNPNCGACGNDCRVYGETCCGNYCADLANDFDHCGACDTPCAYPGPYEDGACVDGHCFYACVEGAVKCNGECSVLDSDPNNCGACGNVCPASAPVCIGGVCSDPGCAPSLTWCDPGCVDLRSDPFNCGACYLQCAPSEVCAGGICQGF